MPPQRGGPVGQGKKSMFHISFTANAHPGKRVSGGIRCWCERGGALPAAEQLEPSPRHSCGELCYSASKMTFFCGSLICAWNNADIVSRACLGGACKTGPTEGGIGLLVALCQAAVARWGQGREDIPPAREDSGGGRNSAAHFAGSEVCGQKAGCQLYTRGRNWRNPQNSPCGCPRWFGKEKTWKCASPGTVRLQRRPKPLRKTACSQRRDT